MTKVIKTVPVITLDGPGGTGKGTLCHRLAKKLGYHFLDSGALYRVLAHAVQQAPLDLNDVDAIVALAHGLQLRFEEARDDEVLVFLKDNEISALIRTEACGEAASRLAANQAVRQALLARQRAFATSPGLVTDGRDMGTVVFPDACLKFYLDASLEERASRRYLQLKRQGNNASLAQVVDELSTRDARDQARAHSPLRAADDAVYIDTTSLNVTEVFDCLWSHVVACGLWHQKGEGG